MKICMMTNTYLPHVGGVARSVSTFVDDYRELGHRVLVVAPQFEGKPLAKKDERVVERVAAMQQFNGSDFSVRLPLATALSERLANFKADVVHSHHPFLLGDTALRFGIKNDAPVIFTHHTLYERYTHYVPFDSPGLQEFVIGLSTHYANLCDGVIAPSESIAKLIESRGVTSPIKVIPTGIDLQKFAAGDGARARKKLKISPDTLVIGHVGRLAAEKNLTWLGDAVGRFLVDAPKARFLVVGGGPAETDLRTALEAHGVADRLILPGKLTGRALYDAYKTMHVFAFSSQSETQGMVLAEAMAAGLPVVALDASGAREVVTDRVNGFLLPSDANPADFAAALQRLGEDESLRREFSAKALETAALFARERSAKLALDFYTEIVALKRRERVIEGESPWEHLLKRVELEWRLVSTRAQKAIEVLTSPLPSREEEEKILANA